MPATRPTRRKKSGLITGAATRVAEVATTLGTRIGATVRAPAAQIASFVHDTAQHLPMIGTASQRPRKRAKPKAAKPVPKAKRSRPPRRRA